MDADEIVKEGFSCIVSGSKSDLCVYDVMTYCWPNEDATRGYDFVSLFTPSSLKAPFYDIYTLQAPKFVLLTSLN